MKKQMLGTSALALGVALGAPVSAQEWNMKWGGFYNFHVAYSSFDSDTAAHVGTDFDGVGTFTNAEIHFKPSITLDNGLTFGIDVQYEALNTGGATVDESFLSISSDRLGRIDLGNENSAGYKMMVSAPQVKGVLGINTGTLSGFIPLNIGQGGNLPWNFRQAAISSGIEVVGNNDVPRITYYTPSFNGLTLGVSYAANSNVFSASNSNPNAGNNGGVNRNIGVTDIWDIGLSYKQSFNGVDVNLAARYGTAENNTGFAGTDDPDVWAVGATFGYAGFTFGGHYGENDNGNLMPDQEGWSLGITYDLPGPWDIGFDTFQGEWDDNIGGEAEYEAYQLGASRSLGKGVRWAIYAIYTEGTVNGNGLNNVPAPGAPVSANANTEVEGTIIATSINLSF